MTEEQRKEHEDVVREYHIAYTDGKKKIAEIEKDIEEKAEKARAYLLQCNDKKHADENGFSLKIVEPSKIVFDPDKLEKKIPIHVSRDVVKKKLDIKSEVMFLALINKYSLPLEDLLDCVDVEKRVDAKAIEQYLALGEIDRDMLDDTFEVVKTKSYIKVSEIQK